MQSFLTVSTVTKSRLTFTIVEVTKEIFDDLPVRKDTLIHLERLTMGKVILLHRSNEVIKYHPTDFQVLVAMIDLNLDSLNWSSIKI